MTVSINTFFRGALAACGLALASQAHAASFTVNAGAACTGFSWDGTTLTCLVNTNCVISGPTTGLPGTAITLTAACPTSTLITWGVGDCAGVTGNTCSPNESSNGVRVYTAVGNNSAQDTHSVNWSNTVVAPSGCTLSANPSSGGPAAANVTLTADCSSGTDPITIAWTGTGTGSCPTTFNVSGSAATCTMNNVSVTTTWTASFSSSGTPASNNPRSATYTFSQGGGGGNFASCPGGSLTIDDAYGQSAIRTADHGTFDDQILSVRFVPTGTGTTVRTISWVEYQDGPTLREAAFSTVACSFDPAHAVKNSFQAPFVSSGTIGVSFKYRMGSPSTLAAGLTAGTAYYINIRNRETTGALSCNDPWNSCNMSGTIPP